MGYILSAATAELLEEFLEAEKRRVSAQGYTTLAGITRRVLTWFDDEELEVTDVRITDAVRFASSLSERLTPEGAPLATGCANVKAPEALTTRSSPALSCRVTVPARPVIVPPTVNELVVQVIATLVTFEVPIAPLAFATVHVCAGDVGCAKTVTA